MIRVRTLTGALKSWMVAKLHKDIANIVEAGRRYARERKRGHKSGARAAMPKTSNLRTLSPHDQEAV